MEKCPNCGRLVRKLVTLNDAQTSAVYTEIVGVYYPKTDYYCITCARLILGISD